MHSDILHNFLLHYLSVNTIIAIQVLNLVPKEAEGESFEDALTRVRRCLGGGDTAENADSDSDLEVVTESVTVNLRCPVSFRACNCYCYSLADSAYTCQSCNMPCG